MLTQLKNKKKPHSFCYPDMTNYYDNWKDFPSSHNQIFDAIFIPTLGLRRLPSAQHILPTFSASQIFIVYSGQKPPNCFLPSTRFQLISIDSLLCNTNFNTRKNETFLDIRPALLPPCWDLGLKRTAILEFSRERRFERILMIDDDILPTPEILSNIIYLLRYYPIASAQVKIFPDHSAIGHIERAFGVRKDVFLSGAFLALRPSAIHSYFPNIYNEDWIFFFNELPKNRIACCGSVQQKQYNPFRNPHIAGFQEFGELLAEGAFLAVENQQHCNLFETEYWKSLIRFRRSHLRTLRINSRARGASQEMIEALNSALDAHKSISPLLLAKAAVQHLKHYSISK